MKALIIGATGATGKDLVRVLLEDGDYTEVVAFVRRAGGVRHPKYSEVVTDFDDLEAVAERITGDVWFSCLGTTLKAAGSKEAQRRIDHDIPLEFARIAKRNDVGGAVLLSAYGAAADSKVFYSRLKGELDDGVAGLGFDPFIIFRPGLLLREGTDRVGEKISGGVLKFLDRLGMAGRFRPLPTSMLAEKMAKAPKRFRSGKHVIALDEIFGM